MSCCWASSPLPSASSVGLWAEPGLGASGPAQAGLHWMLWLMVPPGVGSLILCPCHFNQTHWCSIIMTMTMRYEHPEDSPGQLRFRGVSSSLRGSQPVRVLAGPLVCVLYSISGRLANFSTWPRRWDVTQRCIVEKALETDPLGLNSPIRVWWP